LLKVQIAKGSDELMKTCARRAPQILLAILLAPLFGCCSRQGKIHVAAESRDIAAVERLLSNAPSCVNQKDGLGRTPLYLAAWLDQPAILSLLLQNGGDPNIGASWKGNAVPLHVASRNAHIEIVRRLIEAGAKVNVKDDGGDTPLLLAARSGSAEVVQLLIEAGADVTARNRYDKGVFCGWYEHWEAESSGLKQYPSSNARLPTADDYSETYKILSSAGARVDPDGKDGTPPLDAIQMIKTQEMQ
jgi:ankyrin repeat protein